MHDKLYKVRFLTDHPGKHRRIYAAPTSRCRRVHDSVSWSAVLQAIPQGQADQMGNQGMDIGRLSDWGITTRSTCTMGRMLTLTPRRILARSAESC